MLKHLHAVLKPFFQFLLLLGAIIGLSGQAFAETSMPCAEMVEQQTTAMASMADCCPDAHKSGNDSAPCKDMAAACLAMVGCTTIATLENDHLSIPGFAAQIATKFWSITPVLYGRTIPPDPDPPLLIG